MPQFCKIYTDARNAKPSSFITFHPRQWPMTNRGAVHHPGPLGKTRCVRIGTITSHCPAFRGLFSVTAKMLVCCPEGRGAPLPCPHWRDGDSPEGSCLYTTKRLGRPTRHWPERSGEDKAVWWEVHKRGEKPYLRGKAGEQECPPSHCPSSCSL